MDETQQQTNVALGFESRYLTAASAHYQLYQECDTSGRVNIYIYSRAEFTMGCYHEVEIGMAYTELTNIIVNDWREKVHIVVLPPG